MPVCGFCDFEAPAGVKNCPSCGAELPAASVQEPDLESELLQLLDAGNTVAAVKRYREATGAGLARAKEAIDTLRATRSLDRDMAVGAGELDPALSDELYGLLSRGMKIDAIRLYRERTGVGLKVAKDAVEAVAIRRGLPAKGSGCLGMVLLAIASGGLALAMC
ncbi:MAG: hypothetical protein WBC44_20080 [Planctomycetaceae bacterium]